MWVGTRLPQPQFLVISTQALTVNNVGTDDDIVSVAATTERTEKSNNPISIKITQSKLKGVKATGIIGFS